MYHAERVVKDSTSANTIPLYSFLQVPAPVYSFSFAQSPDWTSFFPKQGELKVYFNRIASEYGLLDKCQLQTVVREARFDESTNLWHLAAEELHTNKQFHYVCKLFCSAVGGLSVPKECDIPGNENFKGPLFHSARWDWSVDLKGKDVIVVGNGCSATQFVPEIAKEVKTLTQAVRSKHWYEKPPKNPFSYIPGWKWLIKHIPFFMKLQRFLIWCVLESHFTYALLNPIGALSRVMMTRSSINHAKTLAPKEYWPALLPDKKQLYACKRRVLDDKYLPCLNRDNVKLETTGLKEIQEDCVVTASGKKLKADVIIMANGFRLDRAGFPMSVYGRNNTEIHEHWNEFGGGGPVNYRSTLMSGFPNYVNLVGVNSATGLV
jgi:cation diffusion facilitator CzcD-associated flavoprotein CzcO